jgi:hypothetical protein
LKEELESERTIIRYLLGELSAEEQSLLEERYFSDPDFLELVLATEDELVDAYVQDRLAQDQRRRFESYFLSSADGREKVELARIMSRQLDESVFGAATSVSGVRSSRTETAAPRIPSLNALLRMPVTAPQLVLALFLLVAVCGGVWLLVREKGSQGNPGPAMAGQTEGNSPAQKGPAPAEERGPDARRTDGGTARVEPSPTQPTPVAERRPAAKPRPDHPAVASFVLIPGLVRSGGETNTVALRQGIKTVKLQLSLDADTDYESFGASLRRVGGAEIWSRRIQGRRHGAASKAGRLNSVTLTLPAGLLSGGDYLLTLTGTTSAGEDEVAGDYPFTVTRKR